MNMNYMKKIGYLKGLAEGLGPDSSTKEGKLISALIDVVEEMAEALSALEDSVSAVEEQIEDLYEEFDGITDEIDAIQMRGIDVGEKDNIRLFRHRDDDDGDDDDDEDDEDEDDVLYQLDCPACKGEIILDEDDLDSDMITCPNCGAQLELDVGCECCSHDGDDDEDGLDF